MEVEAAGKDFTSVIEKGAEQEVDVNVVNQDSEADCKKGGALASGEEVDIWTFRNIGFILQYFAVGLIYGGLPATVYGFFLGYLNVPGYIYATASVVTTLPWSFKVAFGLLNDCLPIRGYRRKPYMVLGWSLCFVVLVVLSSKPLPEPYYCRLPDGGFDEDKVCNEEAQMQGGSFALLMCLAALGYVVADVAADGLMVEFAQREPEEKRGTIQTTIYLVRTLGMVFAVALVGIGMNGKEMIDQVFEDILEREGRPLEFGDLVETIMNLRGSNPATVQDLKASIRAVKLAMSIEINLLRQSLHGELHSITQQLRDDDNESGASDYD